jgi:ArsR family transcriptional regulator
MQGPVAVNISCFFSGLGVKYVVREEGRLLHTVPDKETLEHIAELFKAFGDPTRVAILSLLVDGERCVTDITQAVEVSQSAISHQLRILKQMHLIKARRDGKNIHYSLADDHVLTILTMGLEHVME